MTDNEIMKALECCSTNNQKCYDCPLHTDCMMGVPSKNISRAALVLIKRQQERMDRIVEQLDANYKQSHSDYQDTYNPYYEGQMLAYDIAEQIVRGVQNE